MVGSLNPRSATLGCENAPVEQGYCAECADISPGILDGDDNDDTPDGGHRASDASLGDDEPEHDNGESADSSLHSTVEDNSDDVNLTSRRENPPRAPEQRSPTRLSGSTPALTTTSASLD